MLSFHGKQEVKDFYLKRVKLHRELDNIIKGIGWENGKGCAVGCTLENYDHSRYPIELGIPEWLARLEDIIFENLPSDKDKEWPEKFIDSIPVGVDLENVKHKLSIIRLDNLLKIQNKLLELYRNHKLEKIFIDVISSLDLIKKCHESEFNKNHCGLSSSSSESNLSEFKAAQSAAVSAARSAELSADSAADPASWSAIFSAQSAAESAICSAQSAAESAIFSAQSAAESAKLSAMSAVSAARSAARSADTAAWSAWPAHSAAWIKESENLIELLKNCK